MLCVGIDPGMSGAVVFLFEDGGISMYDMPVQKIGKRTMYVIPSMVHLFKSVGGNVVVGLEKVHAMPKQGVVSMWSMGFGSGLWEGILSALDIPYVLIAPQKWKKVLLSDMPKDKAASIVVARKLFPKETFPRKKDHNRADALLIAEYVRRTQRNSYSDLND
jgi:hypothetical protein